MACYNVKFNDARVLPVDSKIELKKGDNVVVDFDGVAEFGVVLHEVKCESELSLIRVATQADVEKNKAQLDFQKQDEQRVLQFTKALSIELKLVSVLRSLDNKKLLVMYTAADRIDFRQLVKDLASAFKMRIEMRQISERDEAKKVGGCGQCGLPFCCTRFNAANKSISVRMAKVQGLALTPNRINGVCGKLMCCLENEFEDYKEVLSRMPALRSEVDTPDGKGIVEYHDYIGEMVAVRFPKTETVVKYPLDKIKFSTQAVIDDD